MSNTICICCAGRMAVPCPRNPNICLSCEQLLDDDGTALEQLMPTVRSESEGDRGEAEPVAARV